MKENENFLFFSEQKANQELIIKKQVSFDIEGKAADTSALKAGSK